MGTYTLLSGNRYVIDIACFTTIAITRVLLKYMLDALCAWIDILTSISSLGGYKPSRTPVNNEIVFLIVAFTTIFHLVFITVERTDPLLPLVACLHRMPIIRLLMAQKSSPPDFITPFGTMQSSP